MESRVLIAGEKFIVELSNSTLTSIENYQHKNPDLSLTLKRSDLELVMMGVKSLEDMIADGTAKTNGDVSIINKLKGALTHFEIGFEILPGTISKMEEVRKKPFQQENSMAFQILGI